MDGLYDQVLFRETIDQNMPNRDKKTKTKLYLQSIVPFQVASLSEGIVNKKGSTLGSQHCCKQMSWALCPEGRLPSVQVGETGEQAKYL